MVGAAVLGVETAGAACRYRVDDSNSGLVAIAFPAVCVPNLQIFDSDCLDENGYDIGFEGLVEGLAVCGVYEECCRTGDVKKRVQCKKEGGKCFYDTHKECSVASEAGKCNGGLPCCPAGGHLTQIPDGPSDGECFNRDTHKCSKQIVRSKCDGADNIVLCPKGGVVTSLARGFVTTAGPENPTSACENPESGAAGKCYTPGADDCTSTDGGAARASTNSAITQGMVSGCPVFRHTRVRQSPGVVGLNHLTLR